MTKPIQCDKCDDIGYTSIGLEYGMGGFKHKTDYCTCPEGQRLRELYEGQREDMIKRKIEERNATNKN